jgi:uncharacterized protein YegP (UPF0339 family)
MAAKYVIKPTSGGRFMFNLKAANGKVILTSESYQTKQGAQGGIASVRQNAPQDERYERKTAADGQPSFVLKAANGEPIGSSERYSSIAARENGIESVKRNGPIAEVTDQT